MNFVSSIKIIKAMFFQTNLKTTVALLAKTTVAGLLIGALAPANLLSAQAPKAKVQTLELSKKGSKKGRFYTTAVNSDSTKYYSIVRYQPKKRAEVQFDVATFDVNGQQQGYETFTWGDNILDKLDVPPTLYETEDYAPEDIGMSAGPVVVFQGFNLHVKAGRVDLASGENESKMAYEVDVSGKRMNLVEGKQSLEPSFVDNRISRLYPYYGNIFTPQPTGLRGVFRIPMPVHAVVLKGEKIRFGGIVTGKVDLKEVNPDFGRYRYYTGIFNTETMEVENGQYHELGYQLTATVSKKVYGDGRMEVLLTGYKLMDPNDPMGEVSKIRSLITLVFNLEGNLADKKIIDIENDRTGEVKNLQTKDLGDAVVQYGFVSGTMGRHKGLVLAYFGENIWQQEWSMDALDNALVPVPKGNDKVKLKRSSVQINMEDLKLLPNGDLLLIAQSIDENASSVSVAGKPVGGAVKVRHIALQLDGKTGKLKHYYELKGLKNQTEIHTPIVYTRGEKVYILYRTNAWGMSSGYHKNEAKGIEYTLAFDYTYGVLVAIDTDKGTITTPYKVDKMVISGEDPLQITTNGVLLLNVGKHYLPKKKVKPTTMVIQL